jgi:hypothetical protein
MRQASSKICLHSARGSTLTEIVAAAILPAAGSMRAVVATIDQLGPCEYRSFLPSADSR